MKALLKLPLTELISQANKVRKKKFGNSLELCSILNAKSGACAQDCKFCAQSLGSSANIPIYPLKKKGEILKAAQKARENGAQRFGIVTSGDNLTPKELDRVAKAIAQIKSKVDISVCASLGALTTAQLKVLKRGGLARYHHNLETSQRFYKRIVSTHSFQRRVDTIISAKQAGLEVCAGGIIGMGETWQDRIDMANTLKKLDVDSVPLNFLVPVKGTPLQFLKPISRADAIRAVAIFKIILKDKSVKIVAGRETVLKDFQSLGFMAGANGMFIGGYLTVKGRSLKEDYKLIGEIKEIWKK